MSLWHVLRGSVPQQRVWTCGKQVPALQAPSLQLSQQRQPVHLDAPQHWEQQSPQKQLLASAAPQWTVCMSSTVPLSLRDGVRFTCAAAGWRHGAAAADGGYVYTWGCNEVGQCGVEPGTQPAVLHALPTRDDRDVAADDNVSMDERSNSHTRYVRGEPDLQQPECGAGGGATRQQREHHQPATAVDQPAILSCSRSASLKSLADGLRLPRQLADGLKQQQLKEQCTAREDAVHNALLAREEAADAAAARNSERTGGALAGRTRCAATHQLQSQAKPLQPPPSAGTPLVQGTVDAELERQWAALPAGTPVLAVHRLHLVRIVHNSSAAATTAFGAAGIWCSKYSGIQTGTRPDTRVYSVCAPCRNQCPFLVWQGPSVRMVACGAGHTLAALAPSGLAAWGDNRMGQLGLPPTLHATV